MSEAIIWEIKAFDELTPIELHDLLKIRVDVFVVEQACAYPELDGKDPLCLHVMGKTPDGTVIATARIAPIDVIYPYTSIGRVATAEAYRGKQIGRHLMKQSIEFCRENFGSKPIKIAAQHYLERFYQSLGFETISAPYPWDGIDHVDMMLMFEGG